MRANRRAPCRRRGTDRRGGVGPARATSAETVTRIGRLFHELMCSGGGGTVLTSPASEIYYNNPREIPMTRPGIRSVFTVLAASACMLAMLPAQAAGRAPIRWHIVGAVAGVAQPFTTNAYFPRPLTSGELVEFTVTVDPTVPLYTGSSSYAIYKGGVTVADVSGSDWSVHLRAPLKVGEVQVANDDPDYGDLLAVIATSSARPGKTWYSFSADLRNPGGPSPGVGPWQPFTSLAFPKAPPAIGFFPNTTFYFSARRE